MYDLQVFRTPHLGQFAYASGPRFDARMADNRTISQLEAEGYPWIGCECCKGTVWVPFKMLREQIPMLSAMTLDQLGAKMRCDKCGKRPAERYYPAKPERHARVLFARESAVIVWTCEPAHMAHELCKAKFCVLTFS